MKPIHRIALVLIFALTTASVPAADTPSAGGNAGALRRKTEITEAEKEYARAMGVLGSAARELRRGAAQTAPDEDFTEIWPAMNPVKTVDFQGIPAAEIAEWLRSSSSNAFDYVLPSDTTALPQVNLKLQNVAPAQVFAAMNLQFELDAADFKWHWKPLLNGSRPTVVLQKAAMKPAHGGPLGGLLSDREVVSKLAAMQAATEQAKTRTTIFYVGELLSRRTASTRTNLLEREKQIETEMDEIQQTVVRIWEKGLSGSEKTNFPRVDMDTRTEVLLVTGSDNAISLAKETLTALKEKKEKQEREKKPFTY
jgi:hypothetical protein